MSFGHIERRLARLRERMAQDGLDALVLVVAERNNCESMEYITGFRGSSGAVIVSRDRSCLVTDGRYALQAKVQSPFELRMQGSGTLPEKTLEVLAEGRWQTAGYEANRLTVRLFEALKPAAPRWQDASALLPALRRTKDEVEVAAIRKAGSIAYAAYEKVLGQAAEGMTESDFNARLEYEVRAMGAERGWRLGTFLVASGERSALPHGAPTERRFRKGDLVVVDFGATVEGYMSDLTRTFSVGPLCEKARAMEAALLEAHITSAGAIRSGVPCKAVDAVARDILTERGFGPLFTHGLGHGLGLEIHEDPRLSQLSGDTLQEGDVVTVEPGAYIEGWGGMRIEDDYLVTAEGSECLSGGEGRAVAVI